jgi:hypothetical protein
MRFWVSSFGGVAVVLMLAGIRLIGVLTATIASYFIGGKEDEERTEILARLERIEALLHGQARAELTRMEPLDMDETG